MGTIYNNYGEVDRLTAETNAKCGHIRDVIIPDIKRRWDETVANFTGEASDAFQVITSEFHRRMAALEESLKNLNTKTIEIAASGGLVQQKDGEMAKLFIPS